MKMKMFSILDKVTMVYLAPFVARSAVDAKRQIADGFRSGALRETPIGQNPSDFALYELGEFDDEIGTISAIPACGVISDLSVLVPTSTVPS